MSILNEINYFYYRMALYELQVLNENDYYDGLSYNSLLYINVIEQMKSCTVSKVADALNITKSAVTLKINELVKNKIVVKTQSDKDKRVFYLTLSPSTQEATSIYNDIFKKIEVNLQKKYSLEQLELFEDILHTISGYEWRKIQNE